MLQALTNGRQSEINMNKKLKDPQGSLVELPYHCIRNVSSPEDLKNGRTVHAGQVPITALVELPTNENVRDFLVDAEGKQRRRYTSVHRAILDTLENKPDSFSVLNSGVAIVARDSEIDEKNKIIKLLEPSIINGSQTQGVICDFLGNHNFEVETIHSKFELIITGDQDLIAEISIARNFQNEVESISIVGRKGELDDLEIAFQKVHPGLRLQKKETEIPSDDNNVINTEKLLQVIAALLPEKLWFRPGPPNRTYAYDKKAICLRDFHRLFEAAHGKGELGNDRDLAQAYQFYLDIAGDAWSLYQKWKVHQGFRGTKLRALERDPEGRITGIPDGLIFPIIAAYSEFTERVKGVWQLNPPKSLDESVLIRAAADAYMEMAASNPATMGKTKACYTHIQSLASIYRKLA